MIIARAHNSRCFPRCPLNLTQVCHVSSQSTGTSSRNTSSSNAIQPTAPIFNRREKRKLRNLFPRPDKLPQALYPAVPSSFVNRITMADGSSFYLTTRSPRSTIILARDVTNHPLWNPSLAREVADQDQSGRMGRFARRYGSPNLEATLTNEKAATSGSSDSPSPVQPAPKKTTNQSSLDRQGFGLEDLDWISGQSHQSFYGVGNAKNIKGMKKSPSASKK